MSSFFTDKISNLEGPEMIFKIPHENLNIEIFGEEHNTTLPQKNIYKELIKHEDFKDALVLVEHSSLLCGLNPGDNDIFKEVIKKSGSEFIFYKYMKEKHDNIICADNRLEFNLFTRMKEVQIQTSIESMIYTKKINKETRDDLKYILNFLLEKVKIFMENNEYYNDFIDIYKKYMDIFIRHMKIVQNISDMKIADLKKKDILGESKMNNYQIGMMTLLNMFMNIKMLSSLTVDINILNIINRVIESKTPEYKNILIFTGLNHGLRLFSSDLLKKEENDLIFCDSYKEKGFEFIAGVFKRANITPISSFEQEVKILTYFKN
jgi:hypothetical protein